MNTLNRVLEIASRLDHLGNCAEWIARESVHNDNGISQTGTLISVLVEEVREKINELIVEIESLNVSDQTH